MNDHAGRYGDNAPPPPAPPPTPQEVTAYLDYALEGLTTRRAEIKAALDATIAAHPHIDDDEVLGTFIENKRMAADLTKTAEAQRVVHKRPYDSAASTVQGWFAKFGAPLAEPLMTFQRLMNDYGERKDAAKREADRLAAIAAQAEADRKAEEAAEAMRRQAPEADAKLAQAAEAAAEAEQVTERLEAKPAANTRSYGQFGATASMRRTWSWEITDEAAVPRQFLQINEAAIREAAKRRDSSGKPTAVISGISWVAKNAMVVR
jgi:uncharacterized membrane protein YdfJ with MMPL/SSD domain